MKTERLSVRTSGHNTGTSAAESPEPSGSAKRAQDQPSGVPGWPRLLSIEQAGAYLNVSHWTLREFINAGDVPTVRLPRPQTPRQRKRAHANDTVRRLLIDRLDLDELVQRWKERVA
jgi:hypothetical protein